MSEQRENRHIWEGILGKTGAPPLTGSWKSMEKLLDKEMPTLPRRRGWRWLLLALLLLLIGVCNYYRVGVPSRDRTAGRTNAKTAPGASTTTGSGTGSGVSAGSDLASGKASDRGNAGASTVSQRTGLTSGDGATDRKDDRTAVNGSVAADQGASGGEDGTAMAQTATSNSGKAPDSATASTVDSVVPGAAVPKNTATPPSSKKKKVASGPYRGFAAAIGFNQFFPLGAQENAHLNSNGTNGTITDYLPVPEGRYYFSRKLYVQAEVQFNTPQYTSKNLLAGQQVILDTTAAGVGLKTSNSVFIKKLYYFNLPLSVHYSPMKNLYLGAGMEYARLTNGVALFQQQNAPYSPLNSNTRDSVTYSKVQTFKGDSIYQKLRTNEWRLLFDANYQWKGFTLGLRYNRALDKFIHVQVAGTGVTQSRNSSLQLYLRYTIWRQRSVKK